MHNIANIAGKDAIAYVGETPWHRLGTPVQPGIGLDEAFKAASLDWDVVANKAFAEIGGVKTEIPAQAITRATDGEILGVVGPRYTPIQHRKAFEVFSPAIDAGQLRIDVLGALGNGATVWLLLKLATESLSVRTLPNGQPDIVLPYIKAALAHDGSRNFTIGDTGVRVVCANTLSASDAEGRQNWVSIRHTASADAQIEQIGRVLQDATGRYRENIELFRKLAALDITETQLEEYVHAVLPLPEKPKSLVVVAREAAVEIADKLLASAGVVGGVNVETLVDDKTRTNELRYKTELARVERERDTAIELAQTGKGNTGKTAWDAYNGITELVDHTSRRDTDYAKERAAVSAVDGDGLAIKTRALELARELVAA